MLWVAAGVQPKEVWKEMERRERLFGIAEKLLKDAGRGRSAPQGRGARKPPRPQAPLNRLPARIAARMDFPDPRG